jgi:6-pyruvoyltetrahydropterin/6-carboxytetrahydropterin synthase
MYRIRKEFHFSAAHHLLWLPAEHPCSSNHGHNYVVTVELVATSVNAIGFVKDYRELEPIKNWIDHVLDHKDLNEVMKENPTAENLARFIYDTFAKDFPQLIAVEVSETEKTMARYSFV